MALEEDLMKAEQETAKEKEKETKNPDDLTDEEIESVKELIAMPWWEVLKKCMKIRKEKQEENLLVLARDNCFNAKQDWYSFYEVLGALIQGMGEMERLANVLTTDPEDVKKAQEALQKAEAIMRGEKVEWVD